MIGFLRALIYYGRSLSFVYQADRLKNKMNNANADVYFRSLFFWCLEVIMEYILLEISGNTLISR